MTFQIHKRFHKLKKSQRLYQYQRSGRKPFTKGYWDYRNDFIDQVLQDKDLSHRFDQAQALPENYGIRLDERVVEYPWVFSKLNKNGGFLLDAGSTLNNANILAHPKLTSKTIVIYTLAPEGIILLPNISYIYGDLRDTILKEALFETIICISTLEHIGMDNTIYTENTQFSEQAPSDYHRVLAEFHRLLIPGGRVLITVPYGKYENFGWFQQFDTQLVEHTVQVFNGRQSEITYYKYSPIGWNIATSEDCANCLYTNLQNQTIISNQIAVAASAVACLELTK